MIRKSIARAVSSLVTRPVNGAKLSFETVMKKLFANGEQGFYQDPYDLGVMYQDSAGTTAVNASGQPLGLVLDKSRGLTLGDEIFNDSTVGFLGGSTRISPSIYRVYTQDSTASGVTVPVLALNKGWAVVDFEVIRQGSGTFRIDYGVGGCTKYRQVLVDIK